LLSRKQTFRQDSLDYRTVTEADDRTGQPWHRQDVGEGDAKMLVECNGCGAVVDAQELSNYEYNNPEEGPPGRYTFLKCPRCSNPFLVVQEDYGDGLDDPYRLYPEPDRRLDSAIPGPIRVAYQEARACFKAKAFTATAIMCRKTLEGLCSEHGIKKPNLAGALKELRDQGIIENRLFEWAEALRLFGNEAAHGVNVTIGPNDAQDLLDFTIALLEYVYTFRIRFDKFMLRGG